MAMALDVVSREGASVMWQNLRRSRDVLGRPLKDTPDFWDVPILAGGGFGGQGGNCFATVTGLGEEETRRLAQMIVDGINQQVEAARTHDSQ